MKTEVLSIRVKKGLKEEADKLGINVKDIIEQLLEKEIEAKKSKAKKISFELNRLMNVTAKEWVNDTRKIRQES